MWLLPPQTSALAPRGDDVLRDDKQRLCYLHPNLQSPAQTAFGKAPSCFLTYGETA